MNCYFELRLNTKQIPSSEYVLTRVLCFKKGLLSHPPRLVTLLSAAIMLTLVGCVNNIYAHSLSYFIACGYNAHAHWVRKYYLRPLA